MKNIFQISHKFVKLELLVSLKDLQISMITLASSGPTPFPITAETVVLVGVSL